MIESNIHPTAIVDKAASLGSGVKIGPYCIVGPEVILKNNVELKSHVVIEGITEVGEGTVVYPFASLGQSPQILKYIQEKSRTIIGSNNTIREYVTIQAGSLDGGMLTKVGNNCLFMVGVHIGHDCIVGNHVIFANYVSLAGHVQVDDYAIIGGLSAVLQHVRIGKHSMIGGMSPVARDVIPFGLARGERATLEGLNLVGMNRRGFNKTESLSAVKAMKEIFDGKEVFTERIRKVSEKYKENQIVQQIVEFINKDKARAFCGLKDRGLKD